LPSKGSIITDILFGDIVRPDGQRPDQETATLTESVMANQNRSCSPCGAEHATLRIDRQVELGQRNIFFVSEERTHTL
jgi:hypothetical protein